MTTTECFGFRADQLANALAILLASPSNTPNRAEFLGSPQVSTQTRTDHPRAGRANSLVELLLLNICFAGPIAQMQQLSNLSAFVAIFLVFGRSAAALGEWMFGITDDLLNQVQGLYHGLSFLFCGSDRHCAAHLRRVASDDWDCAVGLRIVLAPTFDGTRAKPGEPWGRGGDFRHTSFHAWLQQGRPTVIRSPRKGGCRAWISVGPADPRSLRRIR